MTFTNGQTKETLENDMWQVLRDLKADRIGHAVHALPDPVLMKYLAEHQVGIESNLTSNVQTSTVPDYASHPLKTFLEHGIPATINTDDPGISAIDIYYEYQMAVEKVGLSVNRSAKHNTTRWQWHFYQKRKSRRW